MRRILTLTISLLFISAFQAMGQKGYVNVSEIECDKAGGVVSVSMDMDLGTAGCKSDNELKVYPVIVGKNGGEHAFKSITVTGRNHMLRDIRNKRQLGEGWVMASQAGLTHYQDQVAYEPWMEESVLQIRQEWEGCCQENLGSDVKNLKDLYFTPVVFTPHYIYVTPSAEVVKVRDVTGTAFVDFVINRTEILPDFRSNKEELAKILDGINQQKNNPDVKIQSIKIKGYASPDGPYDGNERLAKGRTQSLLNYVRKQYDFPASTFISDYEPEDWEGLRRYVVGSDLAHKEGILAIIDGSRDPDTKNYLIKEQYPTEYAFILENVYPGLRHSDYTVEYVVKSYGTVEEAKDVMKTNPRNLSLQEAYMVASSYPEGSKEYNETFQLMAELFPDSDVANLNLANVALSTGDLKEAERCLGIAGGTAEAEYARGNLSALKGDLDEAETHFRAAMDMGIQDAQSALDLIALMRERNK